MFSKIVVAVLCWSVLLPGGNVMAQTAPPATANVAVQEAPSSAAASGPELLTPEEEQSLSVRSEEPGREVAGGALTNQQITYILIALATAVLVLILK